METPDKTSDAPQRFVAPGTQPPPEPPSGLRFFIGIACLLLGFVAIFFGGSDSIGLGLAIAGSLLVLASLFAFRSFGFSEHHSGEGRDVRKLYRSHKA